MWNRLIRLFKNSKPSGNKRKLGCISDKRTLIRPHTNPVLFIKPTKINMKRSPARIIFWAVLLELKCIFLLPHNWISLDNIEKSLVDLKTFKVYLFPGSEVIISSNFESLQIINNINFFQV